MDMTPGTLQWHISVPIFRNAVILRQLGIAIGIPFGIVALVIGFSSGKSVYTFYALGLIGALLFSTWLLIMVVYRGRYQVEFVLNDKGVLCRTYANQTKNRIINTLTVILGLLTGKPAVVGAGMLAQARQEVFLKWSRITKVKYKPQSHTILIWSGWTNQVALFCPKDHYATVQQEVMNRTTHLQTPN